MTSPPRERSALVTRFQMNLLLLQPEDVHPDGTARISGDRLAHLREVLRSGPGRTLRAGVVGGLVGTAEVLALREGEAVLRVTLG